MAQPPLRQDMVELVSSKMISPRDIKREHALTSAKGAAGWEIELRIGNAQALDLALAVFTRNPANDPNIQPSCVGETGGAVKRCRVLGIGSASLWARVTVVGGSGATLYAIWGRPLSGATLGETMLTASDAVPLALGETRRDHFEYTEPPSLDTFDHPYEVRLSPEAQKQALVVSCTGAQTGAPMVLTVWDAQGKRLASSGPDSTHQLRLDPPGVDRLYVLVGLASRSTIFSKPQYDIVVANASQSIPLRLKGESIVINDDGGKSVV